ncbi:uncharacterized protein BX663DRAFT_544623 [Cokeromyces recurvatus]|uniref:uncharacterized protein n=1 Tax=Cokeromyces recurvatus TaxID=90255 RepID=UPI00221EED74|nr:uncharacterized protein BX663DRAFT_544623 [Cokeromyces recurvatus]KAI7900741.1 hypothetical protein BX663DRAFT_544623 [Cokeromyces recurvatus]
MSNIREFVNKVQLAYIHQDEQLFTQLITVNQFSPVVITLLQDLHQTSEQQVEEIVNNILEDTSYSLAEAIIHYIELIRHIDNTDIKFVFDKLSTFYSSFIPVFNGPDTFYQLPVVKTLSTLLVTLAFRVDQLGLKGKARKANTAARLLSKMFNIMLADRSPFESSKRQGIFHVTNLAFKVYFKLNSVRMCQTFISNIRTGGVELDMFPISQQVTYKYYIGRYALYHGRLKQAQEYLLFAFERCHAQQWHNKRLILHYLIPTRIILGYFPSVQLLEKYQLVGPYSNLIKMIRSGYIYGFLQHLKKYFHYFYHHLTFLLLRERGVVLVWRCLIKNLHAARKRLGVHAHVISFKDCYNAFKLSMKKKKRVPFGMEDLECILVSLISQGYIRGYIQHQRQRLVLSKLNAFPPISSVRLHVEKYNESLMEDHMIHAQPALPKEIEDLMNE